MNKSLEELRSRLCDELEEIAAGDQFDMQTVDLVHKLASSIKNLDKISDRGHSRNYGTSRDGSWEANGEYSRSRISRDGSYDRDGSYRRRDSMGRFSRGSMIDRLEELMSGADSDHERDAIRKAMEQMR